MKTTKQHTATATLITQFADALKAYYEPEMNRLAKILFARQVNVFEQFNVDCIKGRDGKPTWIRNPMTEEEYQSALHEQWLRTPSKPKQPSKTK